VFEPLCHGVFTTKICEKNELLVAELLWEDFFYGQVDHFNEDKGNDHPFEGGTFSVLHDIAKKLQIFLYDNEAFFHISESYLQVKSVFKAGIQFCQVFIFPGEVW
jgi:hypothetical protein